MSMLLPEVLAVRQGGERSQVAIDLHIPAALDHFPGHFPDLPLLPGIVQIDWAVRFARDYLPVAGEFTMLENIKFQAVLRPDAQVELTLYWDAEKRHVEFTYATERRKYSSGRLVFGGGT
jgi:3-hydroxymyristoyl/3-hydroxydecanoyl-(acyl carrier protein) dehydratase